MKNEDDTATGPAQPIPAPRRAGGGRIPPNERPAIVARVGKLLRAGATYEQISQEVGVSLWTVSKIRVELRIPLAKRVWPSRTVAEALALHIEPYGDGHARWTGPMAGRLCQLFAEGRRLNARHVVFERHHGRPPVGYVRSSCREIPCMTGAHLTDAVLRGTATPEPSAQASTHHATEEPMALHVTGLSTEDIAEVVDCLLLGADQTASAEISARRRQLAHHIGDALDELPGSDAPAVESRESR
ncbi:hypothetical protein ACFZCV_20800 [Streptomyces sp. NPDC007920]|uniref:hypothetical protein n=1 Tax=Streptomyces sp. NPDC007920 TaxID=3364794 RepID=UPI0036E07E53